MYSGIYLDIFYTTEATSTFYQEYILALVNFTQVLRGQKYNSCKQSQRTAESMCDHYSDSLAKDICHTHPVKLSADHFDQWSVLDNIDEETLKKLISDFGLELQHDLPELKGPLHLTINTTAEDEEPER